MAKVLTFEVYQAGMTKFKELADETYMKKGEGAVYTVRAAASATSGYAATYELCSVAEPETEGGDPVITPVAGAAKINIPKDFLVKSASLNEVVAADKEAGGKFADDTNFAVGDKYIDFVVNTKADGDGSAEADQHIYLNVKDLVDIYTGGDGIDVDSNNEISVVIDTPNAHGLGVGANGVKLDLVRGNTYTYTQASGTYVAGTTYYTTNTGAAIVDTSAFEVGVTDVSAYFVRSVATAGTDGAMSIDDKEKLDAITEATAAEVESAIESLFG